MIDFEAVALKECPNDPGHGGGLCSDCERIASGLSMAYGKALRDAADLAAFGDIHEVPLVLADSPEDDEEAKTRSAIHATLLHMAKGVERSGPRTTV